MWIYMYIYVYVNKYVYIYSSADALNVCLNRPKPYIYVCIYTYIYVYICIYMFIYEYIWIYMYIYVYVNKHVYIYSSADALNVCLKRPKPYIYVCIYTYICIYAYICMLYVQPAHTYIFTYIYIHTYVHTITHIYTHRYVCSTHAYIPTFTCPPHKHTHVYTPRAICLSLSFSLTQTCTVHTHVSLSLEKQVSSMSSETLSKSSPSPYVCEDNIQIYTNAHTHTHMCILVSDEMSVINIFWDAFRKYSFPICMCLSYTNIYTCIHTRAFLYSCLWRNKHLPCLLRRFPEIALFHMYVHIMYKYI
jgi:hypothetical protein